MSPKAPSVEEVNAEIMELDQKLADLDRFVKRRDLLLEYRAVLERVCSNGTDSLNGDKTTAETSHAGVSATDTAPLMENAKSLSRSPTVNFA